jgi:phosphatidate cytidylyltransferase
MAGSPIRPDQVMLRTRLIVGVILIALTAGMLFLDGYFAPWSPFLGVVSLALAILGTLELVALIPAERRPPRRVCVVGVIVVVALNWLPLVRHHGILRAPLAGWETVAQGFAAVVLAAFLSEMARFKFPGGVIERIALAVWIVAYLGLLPSFLVQLQLGRAAESAPAAVAMALAIFVPKACDIGAYFTGRFLGRHRMTPVLSPKKTWEGAAGGLILAVVASWAINLLGPVIPGGTAGVVAFGLSVGIAGMLGDLAESLIKRDCERKDASELVPGFGGILDVIDSILFAAPVAYWWLS